MDSQATDKVCGDDTPPLKKQCMRSSRRGWSYGDEDDCDDGYNDDISKGAGDDIPWLDGTEWFCNRQRDEALNPPPGTLRMRSLIGPLSSLECVLLTTMVFDPRFLFPLFTTGKPLDVTLVYDAASIANSDQQPGEIKVTKNQRSIPGTSGIFSLPQGHKWTWISHKLNRGIVHGKMLLLRKQHSLRVIVASSNLNGQWDLDREVFWAQDFPLLQGSKAASKGQDEDEEEMDEEKEAPINTFCADLREICSRMVVPETTIDKLMTGIDFSGAKATLVCSMHGTYAHEHKYDYGHFRLRKVSERERERERERSDGG